MSSINWTYAASLCGDGEFTFFNGNIVDTPIAGVMHSEARAEFDAIVEAIRKGDRPKEAKQVVLYEEPLELEDCAYNVYGHECPIVVAKYTIDTDTVEEVDEPTQPE